MKLDVRGTLHLSNSLMAVATARLLILMMPLAHLTPREPHATPNSTRVSGMTSIPDDCRGIVDAHVDRRCRPGGKGYRITHPIQRPPLRVPLLCKRQPGVVLGQTRGCGGAGCYPAQLRQLQLRIKLVTVPVQHGRHPP